MADRHQFRANWHDYNEGLYFVTICSAEKRHLFGNIVGTRFIASSGVSPESTSIPRLIPSELGKIVMQNINKLPQHYDNVEIWNHVVMPNHIHMIIYIGTRDKLESTNIGCLKPPRHSEPCQYNHHNSMLSTIIGAFKAGVTRSARTRRIAFRPVWQPRFHEHIIRDQHAYDNIMKYIDTNVENWCYDRFNPDRIGEYPTIKSQTDPVGTRFIASESTTTTNITQPSADAMLHANNTELSEDAINRVPTPSDDEA